MPSHCCPHAHEGLLYHPFTFVEIIRFWPILFQLDTNSTSETDVLHHLRCIIAVFLPFIPKALHTTTTDIYTLSLQNKTRKYIFQIESNSEGGGCFVWFINKTGQMVLCMLDSTREVWEAKHISWPSRKLEIKAKNRRHESFRKGKRFAYYSEKQNLNRFYFFFSVLAQTFPFFRWAYEDRERNSDDFETTLFILNSEMISAALAVRPGSLQGKSKRSEAYTTGR